MLRPVLLSFMALFSNGVLICNGNFNFFGGVKKGLLSDSTGLIFKAAAQPQVESIFTIEI